MTLYEYLDCIDACGESLLWVGERTPGEAWEECSIAFPEGSL